MKERIRALLFPPKCVACGTLLDWYEAPHSRTPLCDTCLKNWESEKLETCGYCAKRVTVCECMPDALKKAGCRGFRKLTYYLHGRREPVQNRIVFRLKESRDRRTVSFLAHEWMPAVEELLASCGYAKNEIAIAWLPRSYAAKSKYGVDQSEMLAKALSRVSGIRCLKLLARRFKHTRSQKTLSMTARLQNVKDMFRLTRAANSCPRVVILVDDVITTGASTAACVRLLRRAGAKRVFCLAISSDDANR